MTSKVVATNIPWTKLEDLEKQGYISFLRGSGISKKDFDEKGSFPCIHYGDLYTAYQKPEISEVVHRTNFDGKVRSHIGDVLVPATTTADEMGIAIARAINKKGVVLGSDINILRTENKYLLSTYLSYIFNYGIKRELASYAKGTNILHLSNKDIKKLSIPVLSLPEQKRIVEKLDKIFADIDKAKENTQKNLENAKEIFNTYLNSLSYPTVKLGKLVKITTGKLNANAQENDGKYPFFTCSREVFRINTYAFDCEAILLAGNNASADFNVKYYKGKFNAYQRTYVITIPNTHLLTYKYLYFQLLKGLSILKQIAVGANTRFLRLGMIENIDLALPPIREQQEIVARLDNLQIQTQELVKIYTRKLADLDELKQSVLQQAFSGKL